MEKSRLRRFRVVFAAVDALGGFEVVRQGAEALFELDLLHKAEDDQQRGDEDQDIGVREAANGARNGNQTAHQGDDEQPQRVQLAAENEVFKALTLGWFRIHAVRSSRQNSGLPAVTSVFFRREMKNPFSICVKKS